MRQFDEVSVRGVDLDALVDVLEAAPVTVAVLYGSYARGDETPRSDVDLAVEFPESLSSAERTRARLSLTRDLAVELGTDDVDVVPLSGASADLLEEIQREGILLVGPGERVDSSVTDSSTDGDQREPLATLDEVLDDLEEVI